MSSSAGIVASWALAQTNLYRYGGTILMGIGTVSCILSLLIFTQKNLRKNPCSICFVAFSVANILVIYLPHLINVLQIGFSIGPAAYNLVFCRIRFYLAFLLTSLGPTYLIMASIDRTFITALDARRRKWSNSHTALIGIVVVTLFWMLFHIHAFIYTDLIQLEPHYCICYFHPGSYTVFVTYFALVETFIPIFFTTICALLTVTNLRHLRRVRPAFALPNNNNNKTLTAHFRIIHEKERQLIVMCLTEIIIYAIFCFPEFIFLFYQQITQYQVKNDEQVMIEQFIQSLVTISVNIPFSISSYTYIIVSKTFRGEVKNLFSRSWAFCCRQPTPVVSILR
jgi:hypothetical protein